MKESRQNSGIRASYRRSKSKVDRRARAAKNTRFAPATSAVTLAITFTDETSCPTAGIIDLQKLLSLEPKNDTARKEILAVEQLEQCNNEVQWPYDNRETPEELEDAVEVEEDSDSEDFVHEGTDGACRDFNHDGCHRGTACWFRHAPDLDTTRDELGRNVCLAWLLSQCKKGPTCPYAHDRTYLSSSGWWTNARRLEAVRKETEEKARVVGRPYPTEFLLRDMAPKPWMFEAWAIFPYDRFPESRKEWERKGEYSPHSYIMREMRLYHINPTDPDALEQLEQMRIYHGHI
ncbi:hypothetical protein C8Q79DRAFT_287241 [Trametes meyenii]|nr:hypothetical protein C8Q79DRAFT_287241 [Trametes meyenii]